MADTNFVDGTSTVPGTPLVAAWHNDVNTATYDRLTAVAGTNTITATGPSSMTAYAAGQNFYLVPANTNSGAVTLNVSSLGAKAVTKNGTTPLVAGDMVAGTVYEVSYDGTQFQLINPSTFNTAQSVPAANITGQVAIANGGTGASTAAAALVNLGAIGRLIGTQTFTANGTYTPTAGTTRIVVHAVGGGGGGGGCAATAGGQVSFGSGGGSGAYTVGLITSGFSGAAVTIGNGGTGVSGGAGNTGGTTSLAALITAPGGNGGIVGGAASGTWAAGAALATAGTGGNILTSRGNQSLTANQIASGGVVVGGTGAPGPFGGGAAGGAAAGGSAAAGTSAATTGAFGSGGSGACALGAAGAQSGGTGAPGILIVYEYS